MKTIWTYLLVIFCITGILHSCNNEELNELNAEQEVIEQSNELTFTYKGKTYSTSISQTDHDIKYVNEETETVLNKLAENKQLATFVYGDGSIEYFDSDKEVIKYIEELSADQVSDSPVINPAAAANWRSRLTLYVKTSLNGSKTSHDIYETNKSLAIPNLATIGMDQKVRSFQMNSDNGIHTFVIFYDELNYRGYSITFDVGYFSSNTSNPIKIRDLGKYIRGPFLPVQTNLTWDKAARSLKFYK
ncbi:MAG: hypothetical protein LUF85_16280 [Bacteroides sp.]|nr:hypothetical protein [Bacteroides sp.]